MKDNKNEELIKALRAKGYDVKISINYKQRFREAWRAFWIVRLYKWLRRYR